MSRRACFLFAAVVLGIACCAGAQAEPSATDSLESLQNEYWQYRLRESPLLATSAGDRRYNDRLDAVSLADCQRRNGVFEDYLKQLTAIDRGQLPPDAQINYDILRRVLQDSLDDYRFGAYLMPITQRTGFHIEFPELRRSVPLETLTDYENYLARLRAFAAYTDGHIELMRSGIARSLVLPAVVLDGWEASVDAQIVDRPEHSVFYEPLLKFPVGVPKTERERLRQDARRAIAESVVPAYRKLRTFLAEEYVPHARDTIAASALPEGREYYRHCVRMFTTTDLTPDEVHKIGLAEVKRIRGEMEAVIREVKFKGDFAEFLTFLREDPQFYVDSPSELVKEASFILKHIDGELPAFFGRLPRTPYGIREIPAYVAPRTTSAYYQPAPGDGSKAGFFCLNTYNLKGRPLYNLESLSLHEAVPGHHLQIALQQEMTELADFRRFTDFNAFVEGWALYCERLGIEMGCYKDPYSNFGRLTMEMWRACRLVVDTGMHYFGWSRAQAIQFLADNTALAMHDIQAEVDRYISWPGQALAYKIGELKILELRHLAEEQLGTDFDIREFHDVVLAGGAVPLDVLERNVQAWLAAKK